MRRWIGKAVGAPGFVLPEAQGHGVAARAVALLVEDLRDHGEGRRFLLAFPAVSNLASNAVCRRAGFAMTGTERETFRGAELELNEWALDLAPGT